jgi:transcriptional regulator with XRE-family HTH domain
MKNPTDIEIGQRVRHRRWLMGMTQQDLAEAVGIRFQQVQKYESGANRISASRLWSISRALRVSVGYFYSAGDDATAEDRLDSKETYELVRAYYAMPERPRRQLLSLARAMSNQDDDVRTEVAAAEPRESTRV